MNLTFRQLQAFVGVARLGSFTRAAETIHITQAGLSLMVKEMEEQLGCRLFDRTTRAVWLTKAGARFLPVVTRALQDIDEVALRLVRDEEEGRHLLSVAGTPLVCATILPEVVVAIQEQYPQVRVVVRDVERPALQGLVETGEVDVGVGILLKAASGIQRQSVHRLSMLCVAPRSGTAGKLQKRRRSMNWSDLGNVPLIGLPPDNALQQLIDRYLKQIGRANSPKMTFHNMLTAIGMVEAGFGQAILPSFVRPACERYQVTVTELARPRVWLDMYAITKKGVAVPTNLALLLETLSSCFDQVKVG